MAKKPAAPKNTKNFEQTLWETADKLRGSVESSEYKHVVLSLIFLKFVSDKFEERRKELMAEGKEQYIDMVDFYTMKNVFYLPEESRWSYIQKQAKQNDIAVKIDTALHSVEKNNKSLKGALPDNYFSRMGIDVSKLFAEIEAMTDNKELFETLQEALSNDDAKALAQAVKKVVSLPQRIKGTADLVSAYKTLIMLEREAFGISDDAGSSEDALANLIKKVQARRADLVQAARGRRYDTY